MMLKELILLSILAVKTCQNQCGKDKYKKCVLMADPLLKDDQLIYPDNLKDIDRVCRTWNQFVDCVKRYTDLCFTETKRKEFDKAVENPVDLVHQMCTSSDYQNDYLKHAVCMKATLTEDSHCGRHYKHLVSQVYEEPGTPALCCSHYRFQECVFDQTQRICDKDAYPFAKQILDKAMGFLQDQCSSYKPDQMDCPGVEFYSGNDNQITQPWFDSNSARKLPEINSWLNERKATIQKHYWITRTLSPDNLIEHVGNSRSGHSRDMDLDSDKSDPILWKASSSSQPENVWSSTTAKNTISNSILIDEPNQQGLYNENHGSVVKIGRILYCIILFVYFIN